MLLILLSHCWILYFRGFNFSDKDFSPGLASPYLSIVARHFHTSLSKTKAPLPSPTSSISVHQFHTGLLKNTVTLLILSSHYWGSSNRTIENIDILIWILYFSGFNFSDKDFSLSSTSLFLLIAAYQFHTSLLMARIMLSALSLHDRSSLFHSTEAPVDQFHTSPMKPDFSALLSHYRSSLNSLSDAIHILKLILYCSNFNFSCKDFYPGFASFLSSAFTHQLNYTNLSRILDKFNAFRLYRLINLFKCIIPFSSLLCLRYPFFLNSGRIYVFFPECGAQHFQPTQRTVQSRFCRWSEKTENFCQKCKG